MERQGKERVAVCMLNSVRTGLLCAWFLFSPCIVSPCLHIRLCKFIIENGIARLAESELGNIRRAHTGKRLV